jgi:hypothetical protein
MRIDQIISALFDNAKRSRKIDGKTRRKRADAPKTIEPALSVVRSAGVFMGRDYSGSQREIQD